MATVKFFTMLRKAAGEQGYESSQRTVGAVLKEVEERYGDNVSRYLKNCIVLVNGQNISYLKGRKTKLEARDEISLFPPVAGG
jgi:sulfur-carrier protein